VNIWVIIVIIGLVTYLIRWSFIGVLGKVGVPAFVERPLRFVAPAVLAAIAIPGLMAPTGTIDISFDNLRLVAGLIAVAVAWKTRAMGPTIVAGMLSLWLLDWLF
jgi:branched-subunit amino acid transport protein